MMPVVFCVFFLVMLISLLKMKSAASSDISCSLPYACSIASEILKRFGLNYGESSLGLLNQNSKKIALILLDGFGWNLFSRVRNSGQVSSIKTTSVFPSTTATALASLASGLKPSFTSKVLPRISDKCSNLIPIDVHAEVPKASISFGFIAES